MLNLFQSLAVKPSSVLIFYYHLCFAKVPIVTHPSQLLSVPAFGLWPIVNLNITEFLKQRAVNPSVWSSKQLSKTTLFSLFSFAVQCEVTPWFYSLLDNFSATFFPCLKKKKSQRVTVVVCVFFFQMEMKFIPKLFSFIFLVLSIVLFVLGVGREG